MATPAAESFQVAIWSDDRGFNVIAHCTSKPDVSRSVLSSVCFNYLSEDNAMRTARYILIALLVSPLGTITLLLTSNDLPFARAIAWSLVYLITGE